MELNPYKELDLKDQKGLNQLNFDHDATIQNDTNVTFDDTKDTEVPKIKLEEQEILNTIKSESGVESKPHLISKQKSKIKPKKGQWLVKLHKLLKCKICSKHFENGKFL